MKKELNVFGGPLLSAEEVWDEFEKNRHWFNILQRWKEKREEVAAIQECGKNYRRFNNTSSSSGVSGVHWDKTHQKYKVLVKYKNATKSFGYYDDFTEAVATRLAAEECLGLDEVTRRRAELLNYRGCSVQYVPLKEELKTRSEADIFIRG